MIPTLIYQHLFIVCTGFLCFHLSRCPVVSHESIAAMSQLYFRRTENFSYRDRIPLRIVRAESELSPLEKAYLCAVEKGDYASVKQSLIEAEIYFKININCIDPLGRTALLIAIENENLEIVELLLSFGVYVGDALLHAIRKEVVGAVELLLNHKKPSRGMQVRRQSLTNLLQSFQTETISCLSYYSISWVLLSIQLTHAGIPSCLGNPFFCEATVNVQITSKLFQTFQIVFQTMLQ